MLFPIEYPQTAIALSLNKIISVGVEGIVVALFTWLIGARGIDIALAVGVTQK